MSTRKVLDKAIKCLDSKKIPSASGIYLGEIITRSGGKYVLQDKWGTKYLVSENDYNWLTTNKNARSEDIRAIAERVMYD